MGCFVLFVLVDLIWLTKHRNTVGERCKGGEATEQGGKAGGKGAAGATEQGGKARKGQREGGTAGTIIFDSWV